MATRRWGLVGEVGHWGCVLFSLSPLRYDGGSSLRKMGSSGRQVPCLLVYVDPSFAFLDLCLTLSACKGPEA